MKKVIAIIVALYTTSAFAVTVNPVPFPPKRPADLDALIQRSKPQNYCPIPESTRKQYCTKENKK